MPRRWLALVAVSLATFMTYLDNNVTNVAIPAIQRSLHLSVATSAVALFALTYALIEGHDRGWTSGLILGSFAVSAVAAALFAVVESRTAQPMVALRLFRSRVFAGGTVTTMLWAFGIFGIYFFTSLYLQNILGFSPTEAGLAFVPMALSLIASAALAPRLAARIAPHRTVALGMAVMAVGLVLFGRLGASAGFASLMPGFVLFGVGSGLMQVPLTDAVLHAMPPERSGVASALLNASREVAGLLGITIIGAILRTGQGAALRHGTSPSGAFLAGYHDGLAAAVALVAAGVLVSYLSLRRLAGTGTGGGTGTGDGGRPALAEAEQAIAAELAG